MKTITIDLPDSVELDEQEAKIYLVSRLFEVGILSLAQAAEMVEAANPEVLDINYGCPVKNVVNKMAGAGILQDIDRMVELTDAIVKSTKLPVTVKTRLGWDDNSKYIEEVTERLQDVGIKAISIHGRTRKQMYKGQADWSLIAKVKENPRINIPVFGNGDIDSPQKALEYRNRFGVDGLMIGRASIGYPWIFREIKHYFKTGELMDPPTIEERVTAAKKHLMHSIQWKGPKLGILEMRRHYTNYFRSLPNIKHYRQALVTHEEPELLFEILDQIAQVYAGYEFGDKINQ